MSRWMIWRLLFSVWLAFVTVPAQSSPVVLMATGEGWCRNISECNNTSIITIANTFAGNNPNGPGQPSESIMRDWFAFALPIFGGSIASATISIWNDRGNFNTVNLAAVFNLYEATNISYTGLTGGMSLGSVLVSSADNGIDHFETINLNALALAALETHQGSTFVFGGNNDNGEQIFGYTSGVPIAELTLDIAAVSEPGSILLVSTALACLAAVRRRRRG
jgi:hypothetical protein